MLLAQRLILSIRRNGTLGWGSDEEMRRVFSCALLVRLAVSLPGAPPTATPNRAPLQSNAFEPLPLTSVMPKGWLFEQLRIQARGLSGHIDEFWPDLGTNSGWLGGTGESWERGPYFLDGLVPLAWQLDDARLKAKAQKFIDWTLN